jgi:hypothetical protein
MDILINRAINYTRWNKKHQAENTAAKIIEPSKDNRAETNEK